MIIRRLQEVELRQHLKVHLILFNILFDRLSAFEVHELLPVLPALGQLVQNRAELVQDYAWEFNYFQNTVNVLVNAVKLEVSLVLQLQVVLVLDLHAVEVAQTQQNRLLVPVLVHEFVHVWLVDLDDLPQTRPILGYTYVLDYFDDQILEYISSPPCFFDVFVI